MAPWVDRLRACGNGVVPVVAALAFVTLWGRLIERKDERCAKKQLS